MREVARERAPRSGAVVRAFRVVTLSLIIAVFAAFAAHHAETLLTPSHVNAVTQYTATAAAGDSNPEAGTPTEAFFSVDNVDVLQLVGFGCAALALCALLGALMRSSDHAPRDGRLLGRRTARAVAVIADVVSRIPAAPSPAQLSISRT